MARIGRIITSEEYRCFERARGVSWCGNWCSLSIVALQQEHRGEEEEHIGCQLVERIEDVGT